MMAEFIFFLSLFLIGVKIGNWLGVKIGKWLYTIVHKNDEKRIIETKASKLNYIRGQIEKSEERQNQIIDGIVNEMTKNPKAFLDSWIKMKEEQEKARKGGRP